MNLFEDTEELMNLYQAMDKIKLRFGNMSVGRASGFLT
jgi:DNA polymerase-4